MLRVSSSKIADLAKEMDGLEIDGIHLKQEGEVQGIQVLFSTDAEDEEIAKAAVKKYIKVNHPILKTYVEVI